MKPGFSNLFVCFILSLLIPSCISARTNSEALHASNDLVSKVIKAYGGAEAIEKTRAVYARGKIRASVRNDEGTYTRYFMRDRKLRVEIKYSRSSETRIFNGSRGWRGTDRKPLQEVKGHRLFAMGYQYKQLDIAYGLLKNKYTIKDTGQRTRGTKKFAVMELTDEEGPLIEVFVDLDTYLIIYVAGHFKIDNNVVVLSVVLSDFRMVEGIPMPHKLSNFSGDMRVGENLIEEYLINPEMDQDLFNPKKNHLL